MSFDVDWSLEGQPIAVSQVAKMTGASETFIKQLYRSGDLGPAPDVAANVSSIPLYHVAALFVLLEATKQNVALSRILDVLPAMAGAAYVRFQLSEVAAGHCIQIGGTPHLNRQLWVLLHSPQAEEELERKLPGSPVETKRYACFDREDAFMCDDLVDLQERDGSVRIVDSWAIPALMKGGLPGKVFATHIA
jgi:hypothetical protein